MSLEAVLVRELRDFVLDLRIEVGDGETLALLGPNGSGKTTVLNLLAGLLGPDRGRIVLRGRTLYDAARRIDLAPDERRIGVVFQDYALFPHLTVRENVEFGLRARRVDRATREARTESELEAFGLADHADLPADRLSGGERQRVALARAVAVDPDLLLLDEPFAALDLRSRGPLRRELREAVARTGIPAILVTHSPADVRTCADRVLFIERGRLVSHTAGGVPVDSDEQEWNEIGGYPLPDCGGGDRSHPR